MVEICGGGDSYVFIDNSTYEFDVIWCYNSDVRIQFDDGTVLLMGRDDDGCWVAFVENKGSADVTFKAFGDRLVVYIKAEVESHEVFDRRY